MEKTALSRCSASHVCHYRTLLSLLLFFSATIFLLNTSSSFLSLSSPHATSSYASPHPQVASSLNPAGNLNQDLVGRRNFALVGNSHAISEQINVKQDDSHSLLSRHGSSSDSCDGRKIYMYSLPAAFNTLLLQKCDHEIVSWINFCPHILNHGLGKAVDPPKDADAGDWEDWYETNVYVLEVIFHRRMELYPCRTESASDADAFFIPYYSAIDALVYLYGDKMAERSEQGKELVRWLMEYQGGEYWRRRGGRDHFIVMGRTAWDFTRPHSISRSPTAMERKEEADGGAAEIWGTGFASLPEMENVTTLFLERRPWRFFEQAIPYPTGFHPTSIAVLRAWQDKARTAQRPFLMAFVGAYRPVASSTAEWRRVREAAMDECIKNTTICTHVDCQKVQCAAEAVQVAKRMLTANFCLQPAGDTATRRSTFDGLIAGCIPVFFSNDSAYTQYTWHLPDQEELHRSAYSVLVEGDEIHRLVPLLSAISMERITQMRGYIVEHLLPRLIYAHPKLAALSHPPVIKDAFQLTIDNMLSRVVNSRKYSI